MNTCNWPLGNGQTLSFQIFPENTAWNNVAGLYIFAYQNGSYWNAVYVGQTDSFSQRIPCHERIAEAGNKGATHIHTLVEPTQSKRDIWERMLIQHLQPILNTQYK